MAKAKAKKVKKVALAYSGGLDTSVIIPWLKENYDGCEVIAVCADIGQGDELSVVHDKALKSGASKVFIADLTEDLAAEQKARVTYDNILRLSDDPDVNDVIKYLREREIVHYQRFGEALRLTLEKQDQKNVYAMNPSFP